jgi:hypothetical protein
LSSLTPALSREARQFGAKTARSIAEIQQSVNNMADVLVFLEILGYDENLVRRNGFSSMHHLAEYVYDFVDAYDDKDKETSIAVPVLGRGRRIAEGLSMVFPWLGALVVLFVTGVSLWMAWGLPADITTMFLGGVFLGLAITEGLLQNFQRLFSFYYSQTNIGEVKRSIKRNYALAGVILLAAVAGIYLLSDRAGISFELATVAAISAVTVALHRLSFVIMYVLKKLVHLTVAYAGAFAALILVFFLMASEVPDMTTRYFAALGAAFAVLSGFAVYHHYKIMGQSSTSIVARGAPHFYSPLTVNDNTIASRFGIQLWECIPYFVYGTAYFVLLFSDRILSWVFNPVTTVTTGGTVLPISFNSVYHIGADLALMVILPAIIIQYVMASPIYILVHNRALNMKVLEKRKIDLFLQHSYRRILLSSILASAVVAVVINLLGPNVMDALGGTEASTRILLFASTGGVFLSVFGANSLYMMFLGRAKELAIIAFASAAIVVVGGIFAASYGFENLVLAYLAGAIVSACASSIVMIPTIREAGSRLFSRYI